MLPPMFVSLSSFVCFGLMLFGGSSVCVCVCVVYFLYGRHAAHAVDPRLKGSSSVM